MNRIEVIRDYCLEELSSIKSAWFRLIIGHLLGAAVQVTHAVIDLYKFVTKITSCFESLSKVDGVYLSGAKLRCARLAWALVFFGD